MTTTIEQMAPRFRYDVLTDVTKVMKKTRADVAHAATRAVGDAGRMTKAASRSALGSAGFSSRVQNAIKLAIYPAHDSLHPAAVVSLKAKWASVFEDGATISGKPYLWLPLPNVPMGANGRQLTARDYAARLGALITIRVPGKPPMLAGRVSSASVSRASSSAVRLRKRALKAGKLQGDLVPLFVGVAKVTDPKKYDLNAIAAKYGAEIPALFETYMTEQTG